MNVIYEINPPKILQAENMELNVFNSEKEKFLKRVSVISQITNKVHLTDSVLGVP